MPNAITNTGNIITKHSVVIWKGIVSTLIVGGSTVMVSLSSNDWSQENISQHILILVGILIAMLKNIESLLADTSQPEDSSQTISGLPPTQPPTANTPTPIKPTVPTTVTPTK